MTAPNLRCGRLDEHEPAYTYAGRKPDQEHCDECGDKTNAGSALCPICAQNRYDDQLAEFWDKACREDDE